MPIRNASAHIKSKYHIARWTRRFAERKIIGEMRQQNLFAKAVDKTRCREKNNGGVSLRDQKFFQNAVDKRLRKAYTRVQKMSTRNRKIFFRNSEDKTCFESYTELCRMSTAKKFLSKSVDRLGFGEKYIRDVENSKGTVAVFIDVKMRQNN